MRSLKRSDGIMVARGDLGVEMDLWQVPVFQKRIIARANDWGKPCIVATQMLETMIGSALRHGPRPATSLTPFSMAPTRSCFRARPPSAAIPFLPSIP